MSPFDATGLFTLKATENLSVNPSEANIPFLYFLKH